MTNIEPHTEEIIAGCLQNDRNAQRELYEQYSSAMLGVCRRYSKTIPEAEDIMIEGFLKVFTKIGEFRNECSLTTWIQRIMVNTAIDHYRLNLKHQQDETLDETLAEYHSNNNSENIITRLEAKQVLNLMSEMPDEYRIILNMRLLDDLTFKEIAVELQRNENTVRVYFQRARTWLQQRIQEKETQKNG